MQLNGTMEVKDEGILYIGGCSVVDLKDKYKTPLVIIDEEYLRGICKSYFQNFTQKMEGKALVHYASKAFSNPTIFKIINEEGLGLDVVSEGELYLALKADFPREKIIFHGNNKSREELLLAIRENVGLIVLDNQSEIDFLNELAKEEDRHVPVLLRITPGIEAHTHEFVQTGQIDSKFGFTLPTGDALTGVGRVIESSNLVYKGVHCHIGSQIFEMQSFSQSANIMVGFIKDIFTTYNVETENLDLGGGFGIYYTNEDQPDTIENYSNTLLNSVLEEIQKAGLKMPFIRIEPGRSIIGPVGTNIYTIGSTKIIKGIRKYLAVDGGMSDNIRPALYGAKYEVALGNRMEEEGTDLVSITGKCCESSDILVKDALLPVAERGDILVMSSTGAYGYSMASNYNQLPKPGVVLVNKGQSKEIIYRESLEDLNSKHILIEEL